MPSWSDVTRFGKPVAKTRYNLVEGDPVYFAYYPGFNGDLGHYPPQEMIRVGVERVVRVPGYVSSSNYFLMDNNSDTTSVGDSGGGYFDASGGLIGVLKKELLLEHGYPNLGIRNIYNVREVSKVLP